MSQQFDWNAASTLAESFVSQWAGNEPGGAVIGFDLNGIRFAHSGGVESLSTFAPFTQQLPSFRALDGEPRFQRLLSLLRLDNPVAAVLS